MPGQEQGRRGAAPGAGDEGRNAWRERLQVEERLAISARVVYETIRREGESELARPAAALAWSGLAAGLSMGFSFLTQGLILATLPDRPWRQLLDSFGFSLGFLIVVLGRQQLFTENTLTVILPLLRRKSVTTLGAVGRLWSVVLAANIAGTFGFALLAGYSPIFAPPVRHALYDLAQSYIHPGFGAMLLRGVFDGWLIALMVWLLPAAEAGKVAIIVALTYVIALGDFSHVVAGSAAVMYLVVVHGAAWSAFWLTFFLPTLLGNVLGGVALVAALAHGQVAGGA
jgi:formate/nitrite transporter FocA (FNT family)